MYTAALSSHIHMKRNEIKLFTTPGKAHIARHILHAILLLLLFATSSGALACSASSLTKVMAGCVAITTSCLTLSDFVCAATTLFVVASVVACCCLISLFARFLRCVCSSCPVDGSRRCFVRCSVSNLAYFSLSGSSLSNKCRISGVRGMGSRPRLPLKLEASELAPDLDILLLRLLPPPVDLLT